MAAAAPETPPLLIVGPSWVGDMVMAQSLFKTLKRHQPHRAIDVLAPDWCRDLLTRMPEVRHAFPITVGHGQLGLITRYRLGRSLRKQGYGQAIVLPNSFKSALVPLWAKIPRRTGYVGEFRYPLLNDIRQLNKALLRRTVDRFVALAAEHGAPLAEHIPHPALNVSGHNAEAALLRLGISRSTGPLLALCPGAEYGPAKRWPETHFAQVAKAKAAQGWQVWLFGSAKDMAVGAAIEKLSGGQCVNLCGRTNLGEAIDLMSLAQAAVSNDSGLMHVAAAVGIPLVAIYGSSDPGFTPPLSHKAHILRLGLECSPCFKRDCPLGHTRCLHELGADRVLAKLL